MKVLLFSVFALFTVAVSVTYAEDSKPIDATDLDAIREVVNQEAVIEGVVVDVGSTREGGITFINIGKPKKQGFVAVIFKKDYEAFPEGFKAYKGKKVRVSGLVVLYKEEQPQIVVSLPAQITILEEEPAEEEKK